MKTHSFPRGLIQRNAYMSRIEPFINKSVIKIITGQRRVGKSYILFQLMQRILKTNKNSNIIYINKEDLAFDAIKNASDLNAYISSKLVRNRKNYIFIDEIQEINEFEKALRSLLLDKKNDIYITGSNAKMLSGELSTLLGGRYIEIIIYSLSFSEFLMFHKLPNTDDSLLKFYKYGGLPYLIHLKLTDSVIYEYLKNIYTTIVYKDVVSRYNIRSTKFLERLILFMADNIGSIFSAKRISDFLKSQNMNMAPNQVQTYTEYLVNSFLIHNVPRFDLVGRRIFETGEKYYFENIGVRNSIIGYRPVDQSKLLENIVYNHLMFKGFDVKVGIQDAYEIDFIATKNNETLYVQVALRLDSEKTIDREFGNLLKIKDNYKKIVVSTDKAFRNTYMGIEHIPIRDFLTSDGLSIYDKE